MEYVSVLAGERFSDGPRCTDPMLAALARLVNDATSDSGRDRLGALAPGLAAAHRSDAPGSAALVLAVLLRVQAAVGRSRRLERDVRRAPRHLLRTPTRERAAPWSWCTDLAHRHGAGRRRLIAAVEATAALAAPVRDALLYDLLAIELDRRRTPSVPRVAAGTGEG